MREKLLKLMKENPDLPIEFNCECCNTEDGWYWSNSYKCEVLTYKNYSDTIHTDYDYLKDCISHDICDDYANLTDEEFDAEVEKVFNSLEEKKAICITVIY